MDRRSLLRSFAGCAVCFAASPSLALANDSADSSDSSDSSENSSNAGGSSDIAGSSDNSTDVDQSSGDSNAMGALTVLTTTTLAAVLVVILVRRKDPSRKGHKGGKRKRPKHSEAAALFEAGLIAARRDLALQLSLLANSPAQLDRLRVAAETGRGPALQSLARTADLPLETVAAAVMRRWRATQSAEDAARVVMGILTDLAPDLKVDDVFTADVLWALREERSLPVGSRPTHARVATFMGVPAATVSATVDQQLGTALRAEIYRSASETADALADALYEASPGPIDRRVTDLRARAERLEQLLLQGPAAVSVPA